MSINFDRSSVAAWVDYIQTLHAREIELSLERVHEVFIRLCPAGVPFTVISVAGTNGKGSTSEILASIYQQAGYKAGKFTSPHLVSFNERFNIAGADVSDGDLIAGFEQVEAVRGDTPITYFEYGFLLAIALFQLQKIDVAIMEVGLGGRLDAVNILDADLAIITSIGLDHTAWLGDTLEKIAYEKSGIARPNTPCVIGVNPPQDSMLEHLNSIKAQIHILERGFGYTDTENGRWGYICDDFKLEDLPLPFAQSGVQLSNASLAIKSTELLGHKLSVPSQAIYGGLRNAALAGRCQLLSSMPDIVLDVSHNEASLHRLATYVASRKVKGRVIAVCGMLKDKEISASLAQLQSQVSHWHLATINAERGAKSGHLKQCLKEVAPSLDDESISQHNDVLGAFAVAKETLTADDCLVVFGSFYVAGDIINLLGAA